VRLQLDQAGFSLSELMVVIALVGILSAIATPNLLRSLPEQRVKSAIRMVYADMQRARIQAVKDNRKIPIRFVRTSSEEYYYFDTEDNKQWDPGEFRRDISEHAGIFYGCKGTTKNWNKDTIRESGLPQYERVTFDPKGTSNPITVYLYSVHKQNICYAVTTTNYGHVKIRRFNGTRWEK
jgi:type II secretion system protein H